MKERKPYKDEELPSTDGHSKDPSMREVADLALESLAEGYKTEGESFEVYAQKLKSHVHTDPEIFRHRFIQGYELIMEILHKPEKLEE